MDMAKNQNRLLIRRGDIWYYQRRVPKKFRHIESRSLVRHSLNTDSLQIARRRRDALVEADDLYWATLSQEAHENDGISEATRQVQEKRYQAASLRALGFGFKYKTQAELLHDTTLDELMDRIETVAEKRGTGAKVRDQVTDALLGGVVPPEQKQQTISECLDLYFNEIEFDNQLKKSPAQLRSWRNSFSASVKYFISVVGNIPMSSITRDEAIRFRNWWADRIKHGDENGKRPTPYTANRRIGNLRTLYAKYFSYIGQEDRPNPFRKLSFKGEKTKKRPPFSVNWLTNQILNPGALNGLNNEARGILLALIETGARPSEICNLRPENIHLTSKVPHIEICEKHDREVKASASNRKIPLIGISLEAMKAFPNGFPRYFDKDTTLSNSLMKYFKQNNLLETPDHKIYSIRHAFEDRMLEAGLDYGLRCILMGHKNDRPSYGKGGSMEYRRDELLKMKLRFSPELVISE